jgi:hypothetical protein
MKTKVLSQEELAKLAAIVQPVDQQKPEDEGPPKVEAEDTGVDFQAAIVEKDAKIEELIGSIDGAKAALATATADFEAKLAASEAQVTAFKTIVAGQVKSMRVALSLASVDMTDFTADAIIQEYNAASKMFLELPVGSVIPKEEVKQAVKAIQSSHDASNIKSLGWVK